MLLPGLHQLTWLTQLADAGINFTGMVENVSAVLITNAIANMNLELLEANYNNFEFTVGFQDGIAMPHIANLLMLTMILRVSFPVLM